MEIEHFNPNFLINKEDSQDKNKKSFDLEKTKEDDESYLKKIDNRNIFRTEFLSEKEKKKIIQLIKSGEISNYHEDSSKIVDIIGRESYKKIHWSSIDAKNKEVEKTGIERVAELKLLGKDKEPLILRDGSFNVINVHGGNNDNLGEINANLPDDLEKTIVDIEYSEKSTSNNKENFLNDGGHDGILKMVDSSGKINQNFLKDKFNEKDKASFVMMGGNLRGCFWESLRGVIRAAEVNNAQKIDIHIPLDKCYDNEVYDKVTNTGSLKELLLETMKNKKTEFYDNKNLVGATGSKEDLESKIRFYFWDKGIYLIDEINVQNDLEKIRKEIENIKTKL